VASEDSEDRPAIPTSPREHDAAAQRRGRRGRILFSALLVLFLAVAVVGLFGERGRTTVASSDEYEVIVHYPQMTRPGLSSALEFEVRRTDGQPLPEQLTFETTTDYLRLWDDHAVEPTPDAVRGDDRDTVWVILPEADATSIRVLLDGRIDPGIQWGRSGTTTVYADQEAIATLRYRTWVMP
jgi:hypothetical protein